MIGYQVSDNRGEGGILIDKTQLVYNAGGAGRNGGSRSSGAVI